MNNEKLDNNQIPAPTTDEALQEHIACFFAELKAVGYARTTLRNKRTILEQFSSWRRPRGNTLAALAEPEIFQFLAKSLEKDKSKLSVGSRALFDFLAYLRRRNVVTTCAPRPAETVRSTLEKRYADFLRSEKGLAELSLKVYLPVAADLLQYLDDKHGCKGIGRIDASVLRTYFSKRSQDRSSESVRLLATSLRSFLRFLHVQGDIRHDLTAAIPTVRRWSQPGIPRKLTTTEVRHVLRAPDLEREKGRRDFAILLLLARLGLRSGEILALELGDLRWRTGEILIRGKGKRQDLLPLPSDVGAAIAKYLKRDRGPLAARRIFLRTIAPRGPLMGPASIGHIVRHAMAKVGIERPKQIAAHLFRHTLASRMLQRGASLPEISEVLRHRAPASTEIYAKIDLRGLREVARPWPVKGGA